MAITKLLPTKWQATRWNISVHDETNMYTDVSSSTYSFVELTGLSVFEVNDFYLGGFEKHKIPAGSEVTEYAVRIKIAGAHGRVSAAGISLYGGIGGAIIPGTTLTNAGFGTLTLPTDGVDWDVINSLVQSGNLYIHIPIEALASSDTGIRVYGAEIEVTYEPPKKYVTGRRLQRFWDNAKNYIDTEIPTNVSASASQAASSAQSASTKASEASTSAQTASTKASEATASAQSAASSAQTATDKATLASQKAAAASESATLATAKANAAATSETNAAASAQTATAKASEAAVSATSAQEYDESAQQSAVNAQTAQGLAETAQTAAETAQGLAEDARDLAQQYAESIDPEHIYSAYPTDTAEGSIASFADGADDIPLKSLVVNIDPVQSGSGDPSPTNVRPISGWTGVEVTVSPTTDAEDGDTYDITFPSEAGTVYGGTLNVTTGVLTVDMDIVDMGTLNWTYYSAQHRIVAQVNSATPAGANVGLDGACSVYKVVNTSYRLAPDKSIVIGNNFISTLYAAMVVHDEDYTDAETFKTAVSGQMLVFPIKTPITYQLTPTEVTTLLGTNNIWADTGDSTVEYRADTKLYIERLTEPDADMIADANIVSGSYFMVGNSLYLATANIASGGQVIVGTNCTRKSLATALNEINQ